MSYLDYGGLEYFLSKTDERYAPLSNYIVSGSNAALSSIELSTATPYIDFHYNNSSEDYTSRIIESYSGHLNILASTYTSGDIDVGGSIYENGTLLSSKYAALSHSHDYLPLSGGTLSGSVTFANTTLNAMGDDCYIGDQNKGGCICLKGINANTGIYFMPYSGSTAQSMTIDGNGTMSITGTVALDGLVVNGTFTSAGGTMNGTLSANGITSSNYVYITGGDGDVRIWSDGEGGNIQIYPPSAYGGCWEIDSYNGVLRAYYGDSSGNLGYYIEFRTDGTTCFHGNLVATGGGHISSTNCDVYIEGYGWVSTLFSDKLSLSGGTMTGTLYANAGVVCNDYVSCYSTINSYSQLKIYNGTGVSGDSYSICPLYIEGANIASGGRAGLAFHNPGYNAGTLYLDTGDTLRWCNNSGVFYDIERSAETSDRNWKKNIVDIDERYEKLFMKLRPVNFMWRNMNDLDNHDRIHCGLIAQEVETACYESGLTAQEFATLHISKLSSSTPEGLTEQYSLVYRELHGLEIHMIQKNIQRITELEHIIAELQDKIKG